VHPNYAATEYVFDKFTETCIDEESQKLMKEVKSIVIARKHRAFQPGTNAHKQFLASNQGKVRMLKERYPFLDLNEEAVYFSRF
ncbi:MAG: GSCFA domain-containing protein, partial [Bacteroidota bacterium]